MRNDFKKCSREPTLCIKTTNINNLIAFLYVDDLIFTRNCDNLIVDLKTVVKNKFEMKDLGLLKYFLGIEFQQTQHGILISQTNYTKIFLRRFQMHNNKLASTPITTHLKLSKEDINKHVNPTLCKSMVGRLIYLTSTRIDFMYIVSLISRFMEKHK